MGLVSALVGAEDEALALEPYWLAVSWSEGFPSL